MSPLLLRLRPWGPWLLAALLAALAVAGVMLLTARGWLPAPPPGAVPWFAAGAGCTLFVVLGVLALRDRLTARGRLRETLRRELRYALPLADPVSVARKVGLLRDLAELGPLPPHLEELALPEADLTGLSFRKCRLRAANLQGATLRGCDLRGADLWGADLTDAVLEQAGLRWSDLRGATLRGASLAKADLRGANCRRADLVNANLTGVDLAHTKLERARFAAQGPAGLEQQVHSSVEDWIRARLNQRGEFVADGTVRRPARAPQGGRAASG